jgi:CheY-like chemotaxis protein
MHAKPKVFLVEDHADTRDLLTLLLELGGFAVEAVGSIAETLARFPTSGCDVLLADVGLPDGNGRGLVGALRAVGRSPYAIAMSGYGRPDDVVASLRAGFRHHLVKPVEADTLEALLGRAGDELVAAARP